MKKILILLGLTMCIVLSGCTKSKVTCTITSPKDGAEVSINEDLVVTVEANDTKGTIATVTVYLGNLSFLATGTNPYIATISSTYLMLGKHTIRAVATNTEGAQAAHSISITLIETLIELPEVTTNIITDITPTSAIAGGNITNNGNSPIIARGICWSTTENPTIEDNKTTDGLGTGNFTSNITECTPNTLYYVRAYATNKVGTDYGEQKSFTTSTFSVGGKYKGGIRVYVDETGKHGFIAAPKDQSNGIQWGSSTYYIGGTNREIGMGKSNTAKIVQAQGDDSYAAKLCYDLFLNGYNDWFLPSIRELDQLSQNKDLIGGFESTDYWSSSEYDAYDAILCWISSGREDEYRKWATYAVRCIREF